MKYKNKASSDVNRPGRNYLDRLAYVVVYQEVSYYFDPTMIIYLLSMQKIEILVYTFQACAKVNNLDPRTLASVKYRPPYKFV